MATAKTILIHPQTREEHEFEAAHAARILALPNSGGWELKEEQKTGKDANKRRTVKAAVEPTETPEDDFGCH